MRYLLDECVSGLSARTMHVLGAPDEFAYLLDFAPQSTVDPDIPGICQGNGFDVLVTINVKDFGARRPIYEALIAAGVHVLVLRAKQGQPTTAYWQVSLLARHFPRYRRIFAASSGATLVSVTDGGTRTLTLDEIITEISTGNRGRPNLP